MDALTDRDLNFYDPQKQLGPKEKTKVKNVQLFKEEDKTKYEEFCKTFTEFLYSEHKSWMFEKYPHYFIYYILNNMQESIRKRIYFSFEPFEEKEVFMITKVDEREKEIKIDKELQEKLAGLKKRKGVRNIFEALIKKRSHIVGHNCSLDLLFIITHFGDPLPESLKGFKDMLREYFSSVSDTKYLFENFCETFLNLDLNRNETHLQQVYETLKGLYQEKIRINIAEGFQHLYVSLNERYHDAAFDAYATGCSYIWMKEQMKDKIKEFENKIYMMRTIYSCFNMTGDETYRVPNVNSF